MVGMWGLAVDGKSEVCLTIRKFIYFFVLFLALYSLRIEVDADVCAFLGEGVDFSCGFAGVSEVNVSLVTANGTMLGQGLSISSVTPDNQGVYTYTCLFEDPNCGTVEETFTFNVYGEWLILWIITNYDNCVSVAAIETGLLLNLLTPVGSVFISLWEFIWGI